MKIKNFQSSPKGNKLKKQRLLPKPKREHFFSNLGIAKPVVIAVITAAAILALALLLLFSDRFVGKATQNLYDSTQSNSAGIELVTSPVIQNQPFTIKVMVNSDVEVSGVSFTLDLPAEINCQDLVYNTSAWNFELNKECSLTQAILEIGKLNVPLQAAGSFEIAQITLSAPANLGDYFPFDLEVEISDSTYTTSSLTALDAIIEVVAAPICGNNIIEGTEECDDGNIVDGDGCSATCQIEVETGCGDGIIASYGEECDDGNQINDDGCTNTCELPRCRDGILQVNGADGIPGNSDDEECDDGNSISGDGCSYDCKMEETNCGDNVIDGLEVCDGSDLGGEICQTQNPDFGPGTLTCLSNCMGFDTSGCSSSPVCGDGYMGTGEICDGASLDGQSCVNLGFASGDLTCSADCLSFDTTSCTSITIQVGDTVNGTKITLTDQVTANDVYSTLITATADFAGTEIFVYTVLYGANEKVLSIKLEKVEEGLANTATYTASVNYPTANVVKKSVLVYDVEQSPTVFGTLEITYP